MSDSESLTGALSLLGGLVTDRDGVPWGQLATEWQWSDARAILSSDVPRRHFLTRPRGGSKTTDVAAFALVWLVLLAAPGARAYAFAADVDQAGRLTEALQGFIARTAALRPMLKVQQSKVLALNTGATLEVVSSDAASAWGLLGDMFLVDEFAQWRTGRNSEQLWTAIESAVPKRPDATLIVMTSAGSPAHPAYQAREHASTSPLWRLSEIPGPLGWLPAEELEEQRATRLPSDFARLILNQWTDADDTLALREDVELACRLDGPLAFDHRHRHVVALDIGLKNDRTVAVVARMEIPSGQWVPTGDGAASGERGRPGFRQVPQSPRIAVCRMQVWQGSRIRPVRLDEVEDWVAQAASSFRADVVADPWQAVGLLQRLRYRGVQAREYPFTSSSVGRLAAVLHEVLRGARIDLPDDQGLIDELSTVRLRETTPGVVRLDHDAGKHDDMAVAIGLACVCLLDIESPQPTYQLVTMPRETYFVPRMVQELAAEGDPVAVRLRDQILALNQPRQIPAGRWGAITRDR